MTAMVVAFMVIPGSWYNSLRVASVSSRSCLFI